MHGDFNALLGNDEPGWWAFVSEEVARQNEGVFMEIRFDDFSIWSAWNIVQPDKIDHEGVYIPNDDAEDPFGRPDEHLGWAVYRHVVDYGSAT